MSRTTNINVNVNSGKSISSINAIKTAFEGLKKAKDELGKDGKMKLEVDLKGIDKETLTALTKGVRALNTQMKNLNKTSTDYANAGKTFNVVSNQITNNVTKTSKSTRELGNSFKSMNTDILSSVLTFELLRRSITSFIGTYSQLTSTTFNVGIASQMNLSQIEGLNQSFLQLSKTVPSTANEMAQAVDALIRTGRSFEESRKIIEQVAILSTASGDSLKDTASVVTKVMVSLGVSGNRVIETLNTMHSTAIQTASDMGYLAEAFKNVAGTASVLVKQSGLSGQALDDYKQKVLDVSMASIGSMANLGISASSAGTKIKQMFGKITAGEKSARALFDTAMKLNNIMVDGKMFDFDALSNLTKTDLPKALEMLSQMYLKGQLNTQVMQKMFTARHFMEVSNLLIDINGNIDGFVNGIAKGVEYSDDFYKKMFDINEQWKLLKNNVTASFGESGQDLMKALTGIAMAMNNSFGEETSFNIGNTLKNISLLGASAVAVSGAVKGLSLAFGLLTPVGVLLTALAGGGLYLGKAFADAKVAVADLNINLSDSSKLTKKLDDGLIGLEIKYKNLSEHMEVIANNNIWLENIDEANTLMGILLSKSKDFVDLMNSLDEEKSLKPLSTIPRKLEFDIQTMRQKYNDLAVQLKVEEESMLEKITLSSVFGNVRNKKKDDENLKSIQDFTRNYIDILKGAGTIIDKESRAIASSSDFGLTEKQAEGIVRSLSKSSEGIGVVVGDLRDFEGEMKKVQDSINQSFKDFQEQATKNVMAYNKMVASINQDKIDIFMATGEISLDKIINVDGVQKKLKETFSGHAGVVELAYASVTDQINIQNNAYDEQMQMLKNQISELEKVKSIRGELTEDQLKEYSTLKANLESIKLAKEEYANENKERMVAIGKEKELFSSLISKYSLTKDNIDLMLKYWAIAIRVQDRIKNGLDVTLLLEKKANIEKLLDISEEKYQSKKRVSDYQLKYNNYVKENLSVELELAKILQSQGKQQLLTLEYKKRELEMNKELISDEVELARETLKKRGMSSENIKTSLQAQSELQAMYKKYGAETTDEEVKNRFESLKILTQALAKEEKNAIDIALIPLKEFENISKNLPSIMEKVYSSLQGVKQSPLSGANQQYIEFLKSENLEAIKVVRESWSKNLKGEPMINPFEGLTQQNIDDYINKYKSMVEQSRINARESLRKRDEGAPLTAEEEKLIKVYSEQTRQLEDLLSLKEGQLDVTRKELELEQAKLDIYNKSGDVLSKLGSSMGISGLESMGDIFSGFGDMSKAFSENKDIKFSDLLDFDNDEWAKNFGFAMENALASIDFGATLGSWIGSITGGGASSQAGGALGGLIGGLGGADALGGLLGISTGGAGMAISAGMSLIGGLFGSGKGDEEKAQKKTAEAKKIYDKNTEALNKLAQNMSNLSGGIDGLNSSLISAFSKIPTFGKLTSVTDTLRNMYSTMEKTRQFNEVAYQVTKTKKGKKGFLGIGATADTSWTETIEVSVQEMLNKYGFKGAIEDMTTNQLRDFSKWLEDFDMGDSDNFSVLAGAIEDYAEALDTFDKNINKFFYDTTMESFAGISSLQQEELRQQIEDFYKNLGFQIDDEMSKVIEDLANEMSVMVTIMQDVRGSFVDTWRDSGKTAGQNFLSSMTPYIDAMLENISQVFYDVYFSDVTGALEGEFKALSEQLVELKKQGSDLNWDTVASSLSGSFDKVLNAIILAKQESTDFNDILMQLQKQALEAGLSLSELLELGLVSGTQKTVLDTFKDALMSSENDGALTAIGQMVGDKVGEAMADKLIDNMLSDKILQFSANIDKVLSGGLSFDSLSGLASEAMSVGMMMEEQRRRLEAIKDMFSFDGTVSYESQESNIQYQTGTSTQVVNHYYLNSTVEAGNVVESDSIERLADSLLDTLIEKLRVDRGIDITKNY